MHQFQFINKTNKTKWDLVQFINEQTLQLGTDVDPQVMKYLGRWKGCSVNLYLKDKAAAAKARMTIASAINKVIK